jgi:hypothetical protein
MKFARLAGGTAVLCAVVLAALLYAGIPARGFDLQGTPLAISRPATDITDTYFFPSPTNANDVVFVMDLQPSIPAGAGLTTFFDQGVLYTMKFDSKYASEAVGSRPVENLVIQFAAGTPSGTVGSQTQQINVYGPLAPANVGANTRLVDGGVAAGSGFINRSFSIDAGEIQVFAGTRRDPQFFDKTQFFNIFPSSTQTSGAASCLSSTCPSGFGPGTDYFADSNVLSFVVEMPRDILTSVGSGGVVAYWATTSTSAGTTGN